MKLKTYLSNLYPTGWFGKPTEPDPKTCKILLIVNEAGRGINYKLAAKHIDALGDDDGQSN